MKQTFERLGLAALALLAAAQLASGFRMQVLNGGDDDEGRSRQDCSCDCEPDAAPSAYSALLERRPQHLDTKNMGELLRCLTSASIEILAGAEAGASIHKCCALDKRSRLPYCRSKRPTKKPEEAEEAESSSTRRPKFWHKRRKAASTSTRRPRASTSTSTGKPAAASSTRRPKLEDEEEPAGGERPSARQ